MATVLAGCQRKVSTASVKPDTMEDRLAAARDYIKHVPADVSIDQAIKELASKREASQQEDFRRLLRREIRVRVIEEATVQALARHFTAEEIKFAGAVQRAVRKAEASSRNWVALILTMSSPLFQDEITGSIF